MKWLATVNYDFMPCRTIASHRCAAVSGFEVGGALGEQAEGFMAEYVRVVEWKNQGVGDLAFWSSMTWGGHWRERIGVEIARGVARCVEKAATGGWGGSAATSGRHHEFDRDCC